MDISIVGTGYVGLVSGVCLAEKGHNVTCVDIDQEKIDQINAGKSPIYEDGLDALLQKHVGTRLKGSTDLAKAVAESQLTIIAVGTPFDGQAIDTGYIETASKEIGLALRDKEKFHTVVVKSTVVPGTTDEIVLPILEQASGKRVGQGFGVGMNPEFLREGAAIGDFMQPDRIVYGGSDELALAALDELYSVFDGVDTIRTTNKTAEMIKYTANSLLATLISFSNEIANLCSGLGDIDVVDVMKGVHLDRRLSPIMEDGQRITPAITTYIEAGCGFGGSCFPKDVKALISHGLTAGQSMDLLQTVVDINEAQPLKMLELLKKHFESLKGKKISVLGLAFKPGTDDMRESPSIPIVRALHDAGAEISAFDPIALDEARKTFPEIPIEYAPSVEAAVKGADAIMIITSWSEITSLPKIIGSMDPSPVVIDGRRMIDKNSVPRYEGIGLTESTPAGREDAA
jgi:UDPglucose 6-dehydrogenase